MKKTIVVFILITLIIVGCTPSEVSIVVTDTPILSNSSTPVPPTNTSTITHTPTRTQSPTPTPAPIGGSANPILAVSMAAQEDGQQSFIFIIELFTEREIARIPISEAGETLSLSPDGEYLAFVDDKGDEQGIYLYHLLSGETKLLYPQADETEIRKIRWSPDQKWLAFEMEVFARRSIELWVLDVSNGASRYISSGYNIEWLAPNEVYYQNSGGALNKLNFITGDSETLRYQNYNFSSIEALVEDDLSNMVGKYLPEFRTSLMEGSNRQDPENPRYFVIRRDIDEAPGLYLASYKTEKNLQMWELMLSPDGNTWIMCISEWEGGVEGALLPTEDGGQYVIFTSWAKQEDLPMTRDSLTIENFQPLIFAPDSNSILGLRHKPSYPSLSNPQIMGIEIVDIQSGSTLYFREFGFVEQEFAPRLRLFLSDYKPRSFDIVWTQDQVDLSSVGYIAPTVTPTATLDPNANPIAPVIEVVGNLSLTSQLNLDTSFTKGHWDYENGELSENGTLLLKPKDNGGKLFYGRQDINVGEGVLLKFSISDAASMTIALSQGEWQEDSFRFWGLIGSGERLNPLVMKGAAGHPSEFEGNVSVTPDSWYYLFLGIDDAGELFQVFWAENDPSNYKFGYVDFEEADDIDYHLWLGDAGAGAGELELALVEFYEFDGLADR